MTQPTTNRVQRATFALMVLRYKEQLGAAMRERREELGLTQKQVAEAAHVKESQTVSRWERGINLCSDLEAVAAALKTTIPALMAGIQPPARVAAKLDTAVEPPAEPETQLDRIEAKIDALLRLAGAKEAPVVGPAGARLLEEVESQTPPAPVRSKRTRAASRRKRA